MIQSILAALAVSALGVSSLAATPAKPKKKHHTVAATSAAKKTGTSVKATSVKASNTASSRRKGKVTRKPVRSFQQAPTADRYKEIQQALLSKGYYKGDPNGEWGTDSVDALKRFQTDQNLMPDGKISSLSLIALGLGPKRLTAKTEAVPSVPAAAPTPAPTFEAAPPAVPKPTPSQ